VNTVLYPGRGDIYGVIAKKGLYNVVPRHTNCAGILSHLAQHRTYFSAVIFNVWQHMFTGAIFSAKAGTRKSGEANSAGRGRSSNLFGKHPREVHSLIVKMTAPALI